MNIKANTDFIHNGQPVKQAEVISVPQEDGEALVHSGLAFETSEAPAETPYVLIELPTDIVPSDPTGFTTGGEPSPGQSKPRTSKKKNQSVE